MDTPPLSGLQLRLLAALHGLHARGVAAGFSLSLSRQLSLAPQTVNRSLRLLEQNRPELVRSRREDPTAIPLGAGRMPRRYYWLTPAGARVVADLIALAGVTVDVPQ